MLLKTEAICTYFSHQNDAPCLHVRECFFFRSRFSRTGECLLYNDIQYTFCAQGKEARVLFVFSF